VLVPTVLSRRTIAQLRGARVAAAFLSATSLVSCAALLIRPPHSPYYHSHFSYDPAFWLTMIVSAVGFALSLRLGGRVDDIDLTRGRAPDSRSGEALH
jgi:hypothetical protein